MAVKGKKAACILLMVLLLTVIFFGNYLYKNDGGFFQEFQLDSEALVIGKIKADQHHVSTEGSGYGLYNEYTNTFTKMKSHIGLQGYVYSFLYHHLGIAKFRALNLISCFLLAVVVTILTLLLNKKYSKLFAGVFFAVCLLSPWVVAMAKNLYWAEFLMFLPAVFSLLMLLTKQKKLIYVYLFCTFLTAFIRSLCGYEFLSTILLFGISFLVIEFFLVKEKEARVKLFRITLGYGFAFVLGFGCALLLHAGTRGNTLMQGVQSIWNEDVLRRTLGGAPDQFDPVYYDSLIATPITVISRYVHGFSTPVILGIEGKWFMLMSLAAVVILFFSSMKQKKIRSFENLAFLVFLITALSWLVLGKSHSYIHTTINFIVFYFGYVQICIYVILKFLMDQVSQLHKDPQYGEIV